MAKETANTSTTQVSAKDENIVLLKNMTAEIGNLMKQLVSKHGNEAEMSGKERQRMFGAGVRNYGFIEKSYEILRGNPKFHPANFDAQEMIGNCEEFDQIRQLSFVLDQFSKSVNSIMLASSDKCYRSSLILYRHLKEQSHNRI